MLNICLVTREYPPVTPYSGGIGRQYGALAPALAAAGHNVHVITGVDRERGTLTRDGVRLHLVPRANPAARVGLTRLARAWVWEDASWARAVDRALAELPELDLVYAPEWGGEAASFARRDRQRAVLVTNLQMSLAQMLAISAAGARSRLAPRTRVRDALERRQAERSDAIVGCSAAVLGWARELWDLDGIADTVLPNTTDVGRVRALASADAPDWVPTQRPLVAYSGRLEPRKGVHVLVDAMSLVWDELPEARLLMVGGEPWTPGTSARLRAAAGPHADRLVMPGDQPPERLLPALAAADAVALPSLWEAFGIAALEAMAIGAPTVLTRGSGFEEFARDGENALLVPPGEPRALAAALLRVLGDRPLAARLGAAASDSAEAFDVGPVSDRHAEHFSRLVSDRSERVRKTPAR